MTAGLKVSMFLTSAAADLVRKRAADTTQVSPLEPLKALIEDAQERAGAGGSGQARYGGRAAGLEI